MNRRDALRGIFGGLVAFAIAPADAIRNIAALKPQKGKSMTFARRFHV